MSAFPFCCESVGTGGDNVDVVHTIVNIGGFAESYVIGTGPNPFELRTLQSSDGSVTITQNADNIDFQVAAAAVSIANVGGFAESYVVGTGPNPFNLRTLQSSDASVTITQNADNIDFQVPAPEVHTIANVGGFVESYVVGTGPNPFELRTLQSSNGSVTITQNANNIDFQVPFATMVNIGGFAQSYVVGTGPNPFQIRTLQSSDASVTITQNANNIDFQVPAPEVHTIANVGGFAQSYVVGTGPNPFNLRTLQSSDASVTITQNADNIDFQVSAAAVDLDNIGTGLDVYDAASGPNPFDLRRLEVIDDGSDIHGSGNLAFWTDGNTNKIDLPRGHIQSSFGLNASNTPLTLIDHTFLDDTAGANVAGKNGEDWMCFWSCKICLDPNAFSSTDAKVVFSVHNGVIFVNTDEINCKFTVTTTPSAPVTRPYLLSNTNWVANGGLRVRLQVSTTSSFDQALFEDPSIHIQRFNK